jgi:hypothetical protein
MGGVTSPDFSGESIDAGVNVDCEDGFPDGGAGTGGGESEPSSEPASCSESPDFFLILNRFLLNPL